MEVKIPFPLETIRVKVGIYGSHYHLPECPACQKGTTLTDKDRYDYLEIEIPKILVDKGHDISFLGKNYHSHIDGCKKLIETFYKPDLSYLIGKKVKIEKDKEDRVVSIEVLKER